MSNIASFTFFSIVVFIVSSVEESFASNRITSTGCVLEARIRPHPLSKIARIPSIVITSLGCNGLSAVLMKTSLILSTTANLMLSGQSLRISGVLNVFGKSAMYEDLHATCSAWPLSALIPFLQTGSLFSMRLLSMAKFC